MQGGVLIKEGLNRIKVKEIKEFNNNLKVNTEKSETQEKNWITQIEDIDIHTKLKEEVLVLLNKKQKIEKEGFNKLLNCMVLSLYTLISPTRNKDYFFNENIF